MIDAAQVPGVPESALADDVLAQLPPAAPAPWSTRLSAIVWFHRASPRALEQLEPALRGRHIPVTAAAFVRYADTPVGPYSEILASPVLLVDRGLPAASIPFIAVDSLASIRGGRANWSLPKTLAAFAWEGADAAEGRGDCWAVTARARRRGPRLPLGAAGGVVQATPDGGRLLTGVRLHGLAAAAQVEVAADGPTLPEWLRAGRHPGLILSRVTMRFGAPR